MLRPLPTTTTRRDAGARSSSSSSPIMIRRRHPRLFLACLQRQIRRPINYWLFMRWCLMGVVAFWFLARLGRNNNNNNKIHPEWNEKSRSLYHPTANHNNPWNEQISDEAWQQFLHQFRMSMQDASVDLWLPVVVKGNDLLLRKQHVYQFASYNRMDAFVQMMLYALQLIPSRLGQSNNGGGEEGGGGVVPIWMQHNVPIPLLLGIGDHHECGSLFPRFTWCTTPDHDHSCQTIAIPSFNLFLTRPETTTTTTTQRPLRDDDDDPLYRWSHKKRLAVWRGAPTGRTPPNGDWTRLPRVQLVNYSLAYPHLLDAAFVSTKQFQKIFPSQVPRLYQQSRFAKRIRLQDFQRFRAIIDIDGNSWSSRFGELLCMNSVVIKVKPNNKNYFFDELRPWQHYIPVNADLSNLMDMIEIAVSNETLSRSIVHQANEWCQQRLTRESMALDLFWKLHSYISILGIHDNATRRHQWQEIWKNDYQHDRSIVSLQPLWWGILHWNIPWRLSKPIRQLLEAVGVGR